MFSDPILDPAALVSAEARIDAVLLDVRSGEGARERFAARHLDGAVFVDLDADLAGHGDPAVGGRHPLPDPAAFGATLGALGIGPLSRVVVYDDQGGSNPAARLWWMLRAAGVHESFVLDGGLEAGLGAGIPLGTRATRPTARGAHTFGSWIRPTASIDEVAAALDDPSRLVIDARGPGRYRGEADPFDPNPGHLPGAINVPFASDHAEDGCFLPAEVLAEKYRVLLAGRSPRDVIVSCGSGVTACSTLLAMERAGLRGAKLYVGSFSEWSRSGRPVARGQEPR